MLPSAHYVSSTELDGLRVKKERAGSLSGALWAWWRSATHPHAIWHPAEWRVVYLTVFVGWRELRARESCWVICGEITVQPLPVSMSLDRCWEKRWELGLRRLEERVLSNKTIGKTRGDFCISHNRKTEMTEARSSSQIPQDAREHESRTCCHPQSLAHHVRLWLQGI